MRTIRGTSSSLRSEGAERLSASDLVVAYVAAREAVGLETDREQRAILGKHAKALLAAGRWDDTLLVRAIQQFGITNRHPRFIEEWASEYLTRSELEDYETRKEAERLERIQTDKPMRSLGHALRKAGLYAAPAAAPEREAPSVPSQPNTRTNG